MSIPEVGSKNRLLAFLQTYLKKIDSVLVKSTLRVNGDVTVATTPGTGSGTAPNSSYDNIVVDSDTDAGISVFTPDDETSAILLGSPVDNSGFKMQWYAPSHGSGPKAVIGATPSGASLEIRGASDKLVMEIDSNQIITTQYQPAFMAYLSADQDLTASAEFARVNFDVQVYDNNDDWDPTNSRFTAPVAGEYVFGAAVRVDSIPADSTQWVQGAFVNATTGRSYRPSLYDLDGGVDYIIVGGAAVMSLAASDIVIFQAAVRVVSSTHFYGQSTLNGPHRTWFSGYLLG